MIVLDEPTSGMDTQARQHLWEMLKDYRSKKERLIILTTHFMEEAEYLGNRIGIMGDGKMITCGKSHFLKNMYGAGYILTMVTDDNANKEEIYKIITDRISGVKADVPADKAGKEFKFTLPQTEASKFSEMFKIFETQKE